MLIMNNQLSDKRLIARLDIKNTKVIKGISYEGYRVIGEIEELIKNYYLDLADEIIIIDTISSLHNRKTLENFIETATKEVFIPITICGGIKSQEDINNMLKAGADKVGINSAAVKNPELIKIISKKFGSQCIVLSIEAKKRSNGNWEVFYENGKEPSGKNVTDWVKQATDNGVGEIFVSSIDNDGSQDGIDIDLINRIMDNTNVPVIASSGTKDDKNILEVFNKTNVSAIAIASSLHDKTISIKNFRAKYKK